MGHGFNSPIVIYISWRLIVDYLIIGCVKMDILSVVGTLVHQYWGGKTLSTGAGL